MTHIRPVTPEDAAEIAAIYAPYVRESACTFEEEAPAVEEIAARIAKVKEAGLPYLVMEREGAVAAYAYAGPYHTRRAYRFTVEDSVYVAQALAHRGMGLALMQRLIADCTALGMRQMIARISHSGEASIALHQKLGFRAVGTLEAVGFKFGRWWDVLEMQLALQPPS